jgi:hypothetical protein
VVSAAENSNKFQKKPGFERKKSVEDVVTLGANGTGHTSTTERGVSLEGFGGERRPKTG